MRLESKHNTKENHQITRKESKRRRKAHRGTVKQPKNNEQNGNRYITIYSYFM